MGNKSNQKKTGRWTKDEHGLFLEGLKLYGKNWDKIEDHIGTRSAYNIRSHSQKFLIRLVKFLENNERIE